MKKPDFKITKKEAALDVLFYIIGCLLYSVAVTALITPNEISPGGFTGLAAAFNYLTSFPVGVAVLIINVPVIILGVVKLGGVFTVKTAVATGTLSLCLSVSELFVPAFRVNKILACVFGGILMGAGLSLCFRRGATTGGVDIIATLINRRFRYLTVGRIILLSDIIVITVASLVYKNIESGLYSVVAIYASSRVTDAVLYGADKGKTVCAVTDRPGDICKKIAVKLRRGVTKISVVGGYTGEPHSMLICTVRINEVAAVCGIIKETDPGAFTVITDAGEIIGEGFKAEY
jgi:uncharacterized membrane-anchored protein YitT (DUF2179 family)